MTPAEQLKEKVADLQSKLLNAHPQMPVLLKEIHNQLRNDPELGTVLAEEDICVIVSGLKKQTQTEIATSVVKSRTKSLKNIGVEDL